LGWVAEEKRYSEAADFEVSAAQCIKEGSVGRGAEGAGDVCCERSVFDVGDGRGSRVDG
jgi:hypothetical protein